MPKKFLIKDQVLKIRTLLEAVEWQVGQEAAEERKSVNV